MAPVAVVPTVVPEAPPTKIAEPVESALTEAFNKTTSKKSGSKKPNKATSQHTRSRIAGLVTGLGGHFSDYRNRVPKFEKDAKALAERMSKKYHEMKGDGTLPPTVKQMAFAQTLSKSRNVPLPAKLTRQTVSDFISTWKGIYINSTPYEDAEIMPPVTTMPF
jgi:hypothetical protein